MSYFKKLYKIGEQKVNEFRYKNETPLKAFETEIKKLKTEYSNVVKAVARVKASMIQADKDIIENLEKAVLYEAKAKEILGKGKSGEISPETSDKIALQMLAMKKTYENRAEDAKNKVPEFEENLISLNETMIRLKDNIEKYELDLKKFKDKLNVQKLVDDVDDKLSYSEDSSIVSRLENLKEEIEQKEYEQKLMKNLTEDLYETETAKDKDLYDELKKLKDNK